MASKEVAAVITVYRDGTVSVRRVVRYGKGRYGKGTYK